VFEGGLIDWAPGKNGLALNDFLGFFVENLAFVQTTTATTTSFLFSRRGPVGHLTHEFKKMYFFWACNGVSHADES